MPILEYELNSSNLKILAGSPSYSRGAQYYKQNRVSLIVIEQDWHKAKVRGSDYSNNYQSKIKLVNGNIADYSCTCPVGSFCKHLVALGLKIIDSKKQTTQTQKQTIRVDPNDDMSLILLGVLALNHLHIKIDDLCEIYKRITGSKIPTQKLKPQVREYLSYYEQNGVLQSNPWKMETNYTHIYTLGALQSKYKNQIINEVRKNHEKVFKGKYLDPQDSYAKLHFAFHTKDEEMFKEAIKNLISCHRSYADDSKISCFSFITKTILGAGFSYQDLELFPPTIRYYLSFSIIQYFSYSGHRFDSVLPSLLEEATSNFDNEEYEQLYLDALLLDLKFDNLNKHLGSIKPQNKKYHHYFYEASTKFLEGDFDSALKLYDQGLREERKSSYNTQNTVYSLNAIFYALCMMKKDYRAYEKKIDRVIDRNIQQSQTYSFYALNAFNIYLDEAKSEEINSCLARFLKLIDTGDFDNLFPTLTLLFTYFANKSELENEQLKFLTTLDLEHKFPNLSIKILVDIFDIMGFNYTGGSRIQEIKASQCINFTELFECSSQWKKQLSQLKSHFNLTDSDNTTSTTTASGKKLIWILDPNKKELQAKVQTLLKSGKWSNGKSYDLDQVYKLNPNLCNEKEKKIIEASEEEHYSYDRFWRYDDNKPRPYSLFDQCILNLCGQENVFGSYDRSNHLKLTKTKPSLEVIDSGKDSYRIKLSHEFSKAKVFLERVSDHHYKVIDCSADLVPLKELLGPKGIELPKEAEEELKNILKVAEKDYEIESDLEFEDLVSLPASTKFHALVFFDAYHFRLKVDLFVDPASDTSNLIKAATGRERMTIIKKESREKFICLRNFETEKKKLDFLLESLNIEGDSIEREGPNDCLDLISKLEEFCKENPDFMSLEWKQGEKLKILGKSNFKSLELKVKSKNNWLEYSGNIKIDEDKVVNIRDVLDSLESNAGNYVKLSTGEFLGLSEDLKKSLSKLRYLSDQNEEGGRIHQLAQSSLGNIEKAGAKFSKDKAWKEYIQKIKNFDKLKLQIPQNFKAQFREYQFEGFTWLSRLSYLEAGACLADDMGLGKTIQAIALLLKHLETKACLVVAPTSVINNWQTEIEKFSTGIKSYLLSDYPAQGSDREKLINKLKAGDLLLCSYGLLQNHIDILKEKDFGMVVLDESQAIKNPFSKRAVCAKQLQANFRLVLSGTPIENNLTELWSQFDFINPGLLGSLKNFQAKFANAIEINQDKDAQAALKQLVQPYILRRTKTEVLNDLPPKIEQTIFLDFDPDEAALYESLRRKAVEKLEEAEAENNIGKRKIQILAEMSKLRRACCHPSLVEAPREYKGTKNQEFLELVEHLKSNGHKALVFSQYTSYLKLLKDHLGLLDQDYLYLDGSTPIKKRKQLVEKFQNGEADLFLLSIKAGGSGLNLTEADYVIHLDPWWNPAVEDQATDRAHRIGQHKTVNVYRLIIKNSIEEKILKLHASKRELADELLDEADITAKLSDKDLLAMMQGS